MSSRNKRKYIYLRERERERETPSICKDILLFQEQQSSFDLLELFYQFSLFKHRTMMQTTPSFYDYFLVITLEQAESATVYYSFFF